MTRLEERMLAAAAKRCGGAKGLPRLRELLELGVLDRRVCLKLAIRDRVAELCGQGAGRCEAMVWTADEFCCSYEKVRKTVYEKFNENRTTCNRTFKSKTKRSAV